MYLIFRLSSYFYGFDLSYEKITNNGKDNIFIIEVLSNFITNILIKYEIKIETTIFNVNNEKWLRRIIQFLGSVKIKLINWNFNKQKICFKNLNFNTFLF